VSLTAGAATDTDSATRWFTDVGVVVSRDQVHCDSVIPTSDRSRPACAEHHLHGRLRRECDEQMTRDDEYLQRPSLHYQTQYPHPAAPTRQTHQHLVLEPGTDARHCACGAMRHCEVDQFYQSTHQPSGYMRPTQPISVKYISFSDEPSYQAQSQRTDCHHYQLGTLRYPSTSQVPYRYRDVCQVMSSKCYYAVTSCLTC